MQYTRKKTFGQKGADIFSSVTSGKTLFLVSLLLIILALPVAIIVQRQQQSSETHAAANNVLTWSPPQLVNPVTITITQSNRYLNLDTTKDYILKMPSTPLQSTSTDQGALSVTGGHNIVLIGGEIYIPNWPDISGSKNNFQLRGAIFSGQTGTVHVEGLLITGYPDEGIDLDKSANAIYQFENVRIENMRTQYPNSSACGGGPCDNHPDLIQPWGGAQAVRVDHFTGETNFQGFQMDSDLGVIQTVDIRNANIRALPDNAIGEPFLLYDSGGFGGTGIYASGMPQASLSNFWIKPPSGRSLLSMTMVPVNWNTTPPMAQTNADGSASWPGYTKITGFVSPGDPPTGDFVPAGTAGLNYVSPGYVGSATPTPTPTTDISSCVGLTITSPLVLDKTTVTVGDTINGTVTYTNQCASSYTVNTLVIASRTSTGTNADFRPTVGPLTLAAGQAVTVTASHTIANTDPPGQWYAFASYQDAAGTWYADANKVYFTIPVPTNTPTPTSTPIPTPTPIINLVQNGSFENTGSSWLSPWSFKNSNIATISQTSGTAAAGAYSAKVEINAAAPDYYVLLMQGNIPLLAGNTYTLTFWAKASQSRTIRPDILHADSPWTSYYSRSVTLTTAWQKFTLTFTAPVTDPNGKVLFNLANATGTVWLDSVSLQ